MRSSLLAVSATLLLLCGAGYAQQAAKPVLKLDIRAQPISDALNQFARQSGLQVVIDWRESSGITTPRVTGSFTAEAALTRLLENSGLQYEFINARTVAIRSARPAPVKDAASGHTSSEVWAGNEVLRLAVETMAADAGGANKDGQTKGGRSGDGVEEMIVQQERVKPFSDRNVDLPRTINDEQPYYIFDAKTIERSGSVSVEDFLKTRLTMNTVGLTNAQNPTSTMGNASSINLRGLGADKTLILVNGRRIAAINVVGVGSGDYAQPDLNSIPLNAIERIEVLPSSASGIYGGGAIGGVVNVVLKRDYSGGEVRLGYDNTWDTDSPKRTVSATFGQALESGKTHFMVTGQWSDARPLLLDDRRRLLESGLQRILRNAPNLLYSSTTPFLGAAPNITSSSYFDPVTGINTPDPGTLRLKDGRALNSRSTSLPVGTAPGTSLAALSNVLFQNAGVWNFDLPPTTQASTGLLRPLSATPATEAVMASARRQMTARMEAFLEFTYQVNHSDSLYNLLPGSVVVPAAAPGNPFDSAVRISFPSVADAPWTTNFVTRGLTGGVNLRLPFDWAGNLDYSWSKNHFRGIYYIRDTTPQNADLLSGVLNPFVDTLLYPVNLRKYLAPNTFSGGSIQTTVALRGSGPLMQLPWGAPSLTVGLERRVSTIPESVADLMYPISTSGFYQLYFERKQSTESIYAELQIPLVSKATRPLLYSLDVQLSGRGERYTVDAGTPWVQTRPDNRPPSYGSPTLNGLPFTAQTTYMSNNSTFGFRYQPMEAVTLRTSWAGAFLPPTTSQLVPNPVRTTGQVNDPRNGGLPVTGVEMISGGNPDLKPQNSRSWNAGLIWEPKGMQIRGLRLNVEYYKIAQFDQISSLGAQALVNDEGAYPGRVTRDPTGRIIAVDDRLLNLFKLQTEGWDLSLDYRLNTRAGDFGVRSVNTYIQHEQRQLTFSIPQLDYAGYVGEGGPAKFKANLGLDWEHRNWSAGWTAYYYASYKQSGAPGGPNSLRFAGGGVSGTTVITQGSYTIPVQTYHDLFLGYVFGEAKSSGSRLAAFGAGLLDGLRLQAGVKNVFNTIPPFDANYSSSFYLSPYGDKRLRSYWINASKQF